MNKSQRHSGPRWALGLAMVLLLSACGGGGGSSSGPNTGGNNNAMAKTSWNDMEWDSGEWQ